MPSSDIPAATPESIVRMQPDRVEPVLDAQQCLAALIEHAPVTLFTLDANGIFSVAEGGGDATTRAYRASLIGRSVFDVYREAAAGLELVRCALAGESSTGVVEGALGVYEIRLVPQLASNGEQVGAIGVATDVTAREAARRALAVSEARYDFVTRAFTDGWWETNMLTGETEVSQRWRAAYGYGLSDELGSDIDSVRALVHPDDWQHTIETAQEAMISGAPGYVTEMRMRSKGGVYRWIQCRVRIIRDDEGNIVRLVGMNDDVHERRLAEEALRASRADLQASEARFRELIECAPDAVFVHRGGLFLYSNPAWRRLLGLDEATALMGSPVQDVIHPNDRDQLAVFEPSTAPSLAREVRIINRTGATIFVEVIAHQIDFNGAAATLVFAREITERLEIQARLFQADRLASVGTLAAGVAHEINNPLAYVVANVELARADISELRELISEARHSATAHSEARPVEVVLSTAARQLDDLGRGIEEARQGADRVCNIIKDLKTFSRALDEKVEFIDPRTAIEPALNIAASAVLLRARVVRDLRSTPLIEANESRLGQVVLNLVMNAAQAIPEGNPEGNEIRIVTRTDVEGRAVLEVTDTGCGIAAEHLPRIFDPFFTTKPVGAGTGLGLSVCHAIVTSLRGEITVESVVGQGSTFRIAVPAAIVASQPAIEVAVLPKVPPAQSRARVLIVDDEPLVANVLKRGLKRDHDVVAESEGQAALERVRAAEHFDVIFCDLMMPSMTGMDLHAALMLEAPEVATRMVFLTGGAFTPAARAFLDSVPNKCVEKPFDLRALRTMISERLTATTVAV